MSLVEEFRIAESAHGLFPDSYEASLRIIGFLKKIVEDEEALRGLSPDPVTRLQAV